METIEKIGMASVLFVFAVFIGYCIYMIPIEKENRKQATIKARHECVANGGKIKDAHGGSVFTPDWYCEGAKP